MKVTVLLPQPLAAAIKAAWEEEQDRYYARNQPANGPRCGLIIVSPGQIMWRRSSGTELVLHDDQLTVTGRRASIVFAPGIHSFFAELICCPVVGRLESTEPNRHWLAPPAVAVSLEWLEAHRDIIDGWLGPMIDRALARRERTSDIAKLWQVEWDLVGLASQARACVADALA